MAVQTEIYKNGSSNSVGPFTFPFTYLKNEDVKVSVDGTVKTYTTHYTVTGDKVTFTSGNGPATGTNNIRIYRETLVDTAKAVFAAGSSIRANDLNNNQDQAIFSAQERQYNKVVTDDIYADAITGAKIADDSIDSEHFVDGSIDTAHIANDAINADKLASNAVTATQLANSTITATQIADNTITAQQIAADAVGASELANNAVDTAAIAADAVNGDKIADNSIDNEHLATDSVREDEIKDGEITAAKLVTGTLDGRYYTETELDAGALDGRYYTESQLDAGSLDARYYTETELNNGQLNTLYFTESEITGGAADGRYYTETELDAGQLDNRYFTETELTTGGAIDGRYYTETELNAGQLDNRYYTETELNAGQLDNRYYTETEADARYYRLGSVEEIQSGETWVAADNKVATTSAIDARIVDLVDDVGGFVPIANETSFPAANPDVNNGAGTLVSIKSLASNLTSNGSGVATIANGAGTGNTVTINGLANSTTYAATFGMIVETTSTLHTYAFHRSTPKATEVTTVAGSIANVNTAATNIANINTVASDLNEGTSEIDTVATNIANVNTVGGAISNVNTVATNISGVHHYADVYQVATSQPTERPDSDALEAGDMWFDSSSNKELKVHNGTAYQLVTPSQGVLDDIAIVSGVITYSEDLGLITAGVTTGSSNGSLDLVADALEDEITWVVTSPNDNEYIIDGVTDPTLTLHKGWTYTFDLSDNSNSSHPLRFKSGGSAYTTNVTVTGTQGQAGSKVTIKVPESQPASFEYYCTNHSGMGNTITVVEDPVKGVADIAANVTTVAGIASNVTSVANNTSNINSAVSNATNINAAVSNATNINAVAGNATNINAVAGNNSNITSVAGNSTNINSAVSNATNINSAVSNATNINSAVSNATNINTVSGSIADVNRYANEYKIASSAPGSPDAGDLWYDSSSNTLKNYNGSSWLGITSSSGIQNVVDDSTPQLGGALDGQNNNMSNIGTIDGSNLQLDFGTL